MFKVSNFTECYVIEMSWVGSMKETTVRVKVTRKNIHKNYLKNLHSVCVINDTGTPHVSEYPVNNIKGEHKEHTRFVYCENFVDAYRVINYYKQHALRIISMLGYSRQHAELGFDNLACVDFGKEKINIDDYLQ